MRSLRFSWLLVLLPLLSGCSLLVDFDEEGQPCDGRNQCLEGYTCKDSKCTASPGAGGPDAGTGGSSLCEAPEGCPELPPEAR